MIAGLILFSHNAVLILKQKVRAFPVGKTVEPFQVVHIHIHFAVVIVKLFIVHQMVALVAGVFHGDLSF